MKHETDRNTKSEEPQMLFDTLKYGADCRTVTVALCRAVAVAL